MTKPHTTFPNRIALSTIALAAAALTATALAAGVARADEFSGGAASPPVEYFHSGRSAPPVFATSPARPGEYVLAAPSAGLDANDVTSKSHGHP